MSQFKHPASDYRDVSTHKAQHGDTDWLGWSSAAHGRAKTFETSSSGSASGPC